jgi:hypothetical protein
VKREVQTVGTPGRRTGKEGRGARCRLRGGEAGAPPPHICPGAGLGGHGDADVSRQGQDRGRHRRGLKQLSRVLGSTAADAAAVALDV